MTEFVDGLITGLVVGWLSTGLLLFAVLCIISGGKR